MPSVSSVLLFWIMSVISLTREERTSNARVSLYPPTRPGSGRPSGVSWGSVSAPVGSRRTAPAAAAGAEAADGGLGSPEHRGLPGPAVDEAGLAADAAPPWGVAGEGLAAAEAALRPAAQPVPLRHVAARSGRADAGELDVEGAA